MAFSPTRFASCLAPPTPAGCRVWTRYADPGTGYGRVRIDNKNCYAHVVAWELVNGPIRAGQHLASTCSTRSCCEPAHWCLKGEPRLPSPPLGALPEISPVMAVWRDTPQAVLVEVARYTKHDPEWLAMNIGAWHDLQGVSLADIAKELRVSLGFTKHYLLTFRALPDQPASLT